MSVAAAVQFTQGVTVGTAGQALFGTTGTNVTVANGNNTNVNKWTFTVIDVPPGSAVPLGQVQSGALSTWTFAPDRTGGFLIQVTVQNTSDGSTATDTRCFGVKEANGRFVPPFKATDVMLNFAGQARGWAVYMEAWLAAIDALFSTSIITADHPNQNANYTILETGGWVYIGFVSIPVSPGLSCLFPANPPTGMLVTVAAEDATFRTNNTQIVLSGNTKTFQKGDVAAVASYPMTFADWGPGATSTWRFNGLVWKWIA